MNRKIPAPQVPPGRRPVTDRPIAAPIPKTSVPPRRCWAFSFRYWRQLRNFGFDSLDHVSDRWFVSLLERLAELGRMPVDDVLDNPDAQDGLRFHPIDDKDPRTTMKRAEFGWVDRVYLDNEESYTFFQFHVSKALGRVIGFFDENKVFSILLLDPHHNMQLSKFARYQVRKCGLLESEYGILRSSIDKAINHLAEDEVEKAKRTLAKATIDRTGPDGEARAVITVSDKDARYVEQLMEQGVTLRQIFEEGVLKLMEEPAKLAAISANFVEGEDQ